MKESAPVPDPELPFESQKESAAAQPAPAGKKVGLLAMVQKILDTPEAERDALTSEGDELIKKRTETALKRLDQKWHKPVPRTPPVKPVVRTHADHSSKGMQAIEDAAFERTEEEQKNGTHN